MPTHSFRRKKTHFISKKKFKPKFRTNNSCTNSNKGLRKIILRDQLNNVGMTQIMIKNRRQQGKNSYRMTQPTNLLQTQIFLFQIQILLLQHGVLELEAQSSWLIQRNLMTAFGLQMTTNMIHPLQKTGPLKVLKEQMSTRLTQLP